MSDGFLTNRKVIMKKQLRFILTDIGYLILFAAIALGVVGWAWNIVKLVGLIDGSITAMFVARVIGVFVTPFGSVLGFF
jgi:hypothetical protein